MLTSVKYYSLYLGVL